MLMSEKEDFLLGLKQAGLIEDYKWVNNEAVVTVKRPINYLRIEVVQKKCECGCCDVPDHGACLRFEQGGNGRCAHCDHAKPCHRRDISV
jgi:hypothetical protein